MRYSIFDPTGNITALVESAVTIERQPIVALEIMRRHPQVEQVGFVRMGSVDVDAELRMAGGEFCGNASMCTAALYLLRRDSADASDAWETVRLSVSGAVGIVETRLRKEGPNSFAARINMPAALRIDTRELAFQQMREELPIVVMEGISHIVIQSSSVFFALRERPFDAELAVCAWCKELGADGLGLMFLEGEGAERRMTPLVYVPGSGTVFWENSCASGSSAVGRYLAAASGSPISLALQEPGGTLCVESNPTSGETWLQGAVRLVESLTIEELS